VTSIAQIGLRERLGLNRFGVLPGFGPALGFTLMYLSLVVLIPLSGLVLRALGMSFDEFIDKAFSERALAAYRLSFGGAFIAASFNAVAGVLIAWVLVRYRFVGSRLVDAIVDLPFALPTAVAGLALTAVYAEDGWLGAPLEAIGVKVAFTPLGVVIAMVLVGLPFVVRVVQPVLADFETEVEEAAYTLGAPRRQIVRRVILPALLPAILTGYTLAFARAVGEYGSVIFIAGNMPGISEIAPLLIVIQLEQFNYEGATAIATVMLIASLVLLLLINSLQSWLRRTRGH
jgi:sulfate transport system permease protein